MNMNKKSIIGLALAVVALALVGALVSGLGETAAASVGKAVWYLPYVALVGAVRCFRAA